MSPFVTLIFYHFLSPPFLLFTRAPRKKFCPGKNLNKFQVMDSLAETLTNVDVEQDVVVEQSVKTLLAHINVNADQDSKVSFVL